MSWSPTPPPSFEPLDSRNGTPGDGASEHTRSVSDHLAYGFDDAARLLAVSSPQPSDTEDWLPKLDLPAQGVDLVRGGA